MQVADAVVIDQFLGAGGGVDFGHAEQAALVDVAILEVPAGAVFGGQGNTLDALVVAIQVQDEQGLEGGTWMDADRHVSVALDAQ
ncbi:hypothetical protein D3C76_1719790 [compost metagenome]